MSMEATQRVPFVKATACGNDFLIVETAQVPGDRTEFTRKICDRHFGVGADGVEWLSSATNPDIDVQIHLINADGSAAEISGNGTRCVAAHWFAQRAFRTEHKDRVTIETDAGIRVCVLTQGSDVEFELETAMGQAEVGDSVALRLSGGEMCGIYVSTGNPHFVVLVEDFPLHWQAQGAEIGAHPHFKNGVNVEFVKVIDPGNIEIRIFERGAGETQSSGTGSCASAVAAIASGRAKSPVQVRAPGGTQTVRWDNGEIFLRGPARLVCSGEYLWQD
jgi:diaminopimelate epimerase